jgi:hypothetical protein
MIKRRVAPLRAVVSMLILLVVGFLLSFLFIKYHPFNYLAYIPWLINLIAIPVYWVTGKR